MFINNSRNPKKQGDRRKLELPLTTDTRSEACISLAVAASRAGRGACVYRIGGLCVHGLG